MGRNNAALTVSTIASEVGYSSFSYFALMFRQITLLLRPA